MAVGRSCCDGGMRLQLGMEWPFECRREEEVSRGGVSSYNQLLLVIQVASG